MSRAGRGARSGYPARTGIFASRAEIKGVERLRASVAVAALVGTLTGVPLAAATGTDPAANGARAVITAQPGLDAQIVSRLNAIRVDHGLRRLTPAPGLAAAARLHSRQMALSGRFQHESLDGSAFWKRIRRVYGAAGFRTWTVGENLLWWSPTATAADVASGWLDSPPHRQNLLNPSWCEIGVSAVHDTAAPGDFEGLETTIVTADFGCRRR